MEVNNDMFSLLMFMEDIDMKVSTANDLRALYGPAKGRSLLKQLASLEKHSFNFVQQAPFVVNHPSQSV